MRDREEPVEITVHTFYINDWDDPDLAAGSELYAWEHSDQGQWIMERSVSVPAWYRLDLSLSGGYRYEIRAIVMPRVATEYYLRWG